MATANATSSQTEISQVPPSKLIQSRLARLKSRSLSVSLWAGLALTVAVAVELLAVGMFMDWWLDLPWAVRAVLLGAQILVCLWLLFQNVLRPLINQPDEDELALTVEKARPEFHSRLIASVQLTRPGALPPNTAVSLVDAMVDETEALVAPQNFQSIVSTERLKKFGTLAVTVLVLGMAGYLYGQEVCRDLLKRAFLSNVPVPRKTRVLMVDGDKVIGRGDSVRIEAFADGIIPSDGKVEIKYASRRTQEVNLQQNQDNPAHFGRTIENVQESFTYMVHLNDGSSPRHTITALPRPTVETIQCNQHYPAYTGLEPMRRHLGDLSVLAGSDLQLTIQATKEIDRAALRLIGLDKQVVMTVNPTNRFLLSGSFSVPAKGMNGFSVRLLDTVGMESKDSAVYRVEIIPDKAPRVRILEPARKEELITREGALPIRMAIEDDYFIAAIRLHYKVDTLDDAGEQILELEVGEELPEKLDRTFFWGMTRFQPPLSEGTLIEFWVEAEDNNDVTGPGLGRSDSQLVRIVSADEKRTELLNRAGDYLSGIEDVAEDQEKANRGLGNIILEKGRNNN